MNLFCKRELVISSPTGLRSYTLQRWHQMTIAFFMMVGICAVIYAAIVGVVRFIKLKEMYDEVSALRSVNGNLANQVEGIHKELNEMAQDLRKDKREKMGDWSPKAKLINYYQTAISLQDKSRHLMSLLFVNLNAKVGALARTVNSVGLDSSNFLQGDGKERVYLTRSVPYSTNMTVNHIKESYQNNKNKFVFRSSFLEKDDRQFSSIKKASSLLSQLQTLVDHLPINSPLESFRITNAYGPRFHPVHGYHHMHTGLDIRGPEGAVVKATGKGNVVFAGVKNGYGNVVYIDHGYGITSRFGHLKKINVVVGQKVDTDTFIGVQGATGTCTAEHLHYELRYRNNTINPIKFIYASRDVGPIITASK